MNATLANLTARSGVRRRWTFRVFAVLVGLSPLVGVEAVCRIAGWGKITEIDDPYVGFTEVHPLFVLNDAGDRYEIAASRLEFFRPDWFAAEKGRREFRIFCLGGSTVQGRPYAIETSFTTWLELSLNAADPRRDWQVVNCGGVSYASYRLAPIMHELLAHQPDLFVLYTGHNEFLEDRTYAEVKQTPRPVAQLHSWCSNLRAYNVFRSAALGLANSNTRPPRRAQLPAEVDALLDYRDGIADYHREDAWRRRVVAHYQFNLKRMVRIAHEAGIPVMLVDEARVLD